ncbi:2-dehydro-3-deoxygalactonokinase [Microbaculum marinum]|uniref:2-dehydro-3-deoxygalactonokinase n=1 Tax=Microbaculum marinum TaxID=1764581 RepID=A0AAW9RSH8_9HYPH
MPQKPIEFIAVDWGTTNARAYALDGGGTVLDRRETSLGIRNVADGRFAEAFETLVGCWRTPGPVPVLMSGMIGSRQGWVETAYLDCPADPVAVAQGLGAVPGQQNVAIVPGVCLPAGSAHRDVMRGEEVQCFGALEMSGAGDAVICLPGTHSKWVDMSGGALVRFATSMTGEAFSAMRDHSILGALMPATTSPSWEAGSSFATGVERSGDTGGLLHHLFSVRADGLFDVVPADGLADYLSGILIGHEVREMARMFEPDGAVLVVGGGSLTARYASAFEMLGLSMQAVDAERATIAGLTAIRRLAADPA